MKDWHNTFQCKTGDGVNLQLNVWSSRIAPVGNLLIVHGMGEHSMRYQPLAEYLTDKGITVSSFDLRGHGRSGGKRGHVRSYEIFMNDIEAVIDELSARADDLPSIIMGHSMGGNLVINYLLNYPNPFHAAIISSPWLKLAFDPPSWQMAMGAIAKNIVPSITQHSKLDTKALSRDKAVVKAYEDDPLCHDLITPSLFFSVHKKGQEALQKASRWKIPTLWLHGDQDRITSFQASQEFIKQSKDAGNDFLEFHPLKGFYHETFNDLDKKVVYELMGNWLNKQIEVVK